MPDKVKKNDVPMRVDPNFKNFLSYIQNQRIVIGLDNVQEITSMAKLTRAIVNFFNANPKIKDMLLEVELKNGKN